MGPGFEPLRAYKGMEISSTSLFFWRDGRVVDYNGLENRRAERHRGFESLSLRSKQKKGIFGFPFFVSLVSYQMIAECCDVLEKCFVWWHLWKKGRKSNKNSIFLVYSENGCYLCNCCQSLYMKEKLNFYTKHRATPCNTKDVDLSVVETEMFPDAVYVGDLVSLSGESVPALLPLEEMGGLCFLSTPDNAQQVLHCMENIAFRLLLDLPPGLCNLILYDGTGQGSHLIDLLGLSSRITGGNIMTEPEELRRTLAQMKSDIPNVVQKVLGYRYQGKTLADYNREAGELARPYQLLIIADFPHTLTAEMCESIEQLLQNGRQAGIFIMLNVDGTYVPTQQKDYDVHPLFQKMVTIYQSPTSGDWYVKNSPLESWVNKGFYFHLAEPFAKETLDAILNDINMRLARQKKAEVSLLNMLTPANLWKRDASEGVEIPIGMVNSSEVQYFVLGHSDGTSDVPHHCLVGGATGSGKTVLLHDIICNGAWFYSPEALQFVLLDYKEGTEFKVYEHLPHVRVLSCSRRWMCQISRNTTLRQSSRCHVYWLSLTSFRKCSLARKGCVWLMLSTTSDVVDVLLASISSSPPSR